jgi:hypothetical protein
LRAPKGYILDAVCVPSAPEKEGGEGGEGGKGIELVSYNRGTVAQGHRGSEDTEASGDR